MTLLLLAGTSEARAVAKALAGQDVIASLAGATRAPADLGVKTHIGGFGGAEGFEAFCRTENITAVLDATHPFASRMTERTAKICKARAMPFLIMQRPEWVAGPQDSWYQIPDIAAAATLIPEGATVFVGTGRQTLQEFEALPDRRLLARIIDTPSEDFPFKNGCYLVGKPPFPLADEIALFEAERIDWLVVKNSGGDASRSKLDAAAALNLPVAMIERPELPKAPVVTDVEQAITWAKEQLSHG